MDGVAMVSQREWVAMATQRKHAFRFRLASAGTINYRPGESRYKYVNTETEGERDTGQLGKDVDLMSVPSRASTYSQCNESLDIVSTGCTPRHSPHGYLNQLPHFQALPFFPLSHIVACPVPESGNNECHYKEQTGKMSTRILPTSPHSVNYSTLLY
ncbi:unnamed protein product [Leuciscus chuanchicus]